MSCLPWFYIAHQSMKSQMFLFYFYCKLILHISTVLLYDNFFWKQYEIIFRILYPIYFRFNLDYILHFILENILDSGVDGWSLTMFVLQQQQNLGLRFGTSKMHLSPPVA